VAVVSGFVSLNMAHNFPYPLPYATGANWFSNIYFLGGQRFPKTSMDINVPVLQQGHFLSSVFAFNSGRFMFSCICKVRNFPRFQLLLKMP
jgi:hypothetical protein